MQATRARHRQFPSLSLPGNPSQKKRLSRFFIPLLLPPPPISFRSRVERARSDALSPSPMRFSIIATLVGMALTHPVVLDSRLDGSTVFLRAFLSTISLDFAHFVSWTHVFRAFIYTVLFHPAIISFRKSLYGRDGYLPRVTCYKVYWQGKCVETMTNDVFFLPAIILRIA